VNRMMAWVSRTVALLRFRFARSLALKTGFVLVRPEALARARQLAEDTWVYSLRSGHLTRAFHAGRVVRNRQAEIADAIDVACNSADAEAARLAS